MTQITNRVAADGTPGGPVPFAQALRVYVKIGVLSFGGPAAQIALMHKLVVEDRKWLDEDRFLHALSYCMLLPGPEAQQLATYIGWLLHRIKGGLAAGILFVLPGAAVMLVLSILYARFQDLSIVQSLFFGIKAAVLAVVVEAILRLRKKALKTRLAMLIAASSFAAIFIFDVSFPLIVIGAGVLGLVISRFSDGGAVRPGFAVNEHALAEPEAPDANAPGLTSTSSTSASSALKVIVVCLALWLVPIVALAAWLGLNHVYVQEGIFFSKMAVVTFGGAYAVLAYMAQQAVDTYGWLAPGEMLDGLGLAETTPGPLIMVVQFVGFLGAYRNPGMLDPLVAGTLGALLTTWVTFVPCFLWIFLGAPYIEKLRGNVGLNAALSAITAAVLGVMLNLGVWFAMHVMFAEVGEVRRFGAVLQVPVVDTLEPAALVLTVAALFAMLRFRAGMLTTLATCALAGMLFQSFS